jgi:ABC-2 type transport system ATP-binding protein
MSETVIDVRQLYKAYDAVVAVDHINFHVDRGEIFGLLGPNGAGKTTTIRMLLDIIKPDSGSINVLGRPPGEARTRIGYLPEERGLYRTLPVAECLIYLGELKGMSHSAARRRARELLERVEIADWSRRKVQELSRGMQQKVQIAASLVHDPDVIILDEPFQGLDPVNVEMVKELIREQSKAGKTVVLSAHEMNQVEALCERIALINHGKIVLYGSLAQIKREFAPNAIEIRPPLALDGWSQIASTELFDGRQRVYLKDGASARELLKAILDHGLAVEQFEMATISLDQIFIRVVRDPAKE